MYICIRLVVTLRKMPRMLRRKVKGTPKIVAVEFEKPVTQPICSQIL